MDSIFKALNDPARRLLLDSLRKQDGQTLSQLEIQLEMSRFGVMKHLRILEEASLITTKKQGRFKYHFLNAAPLQEIIDRWIEPLIAKQTARNLLNLKSALEGNEPMTNDIKPGLIQHTFIRCELDALWSALTSADEMGKYHFASDTARGDVAVGNATDYLRPDGSSMLTMRTTAVTPKSRIEMTFEPHFEGADAATSNMVYLIDVEGPICKLTVEHYTIPEGHDSVHEGWARGTSGLKSFLETGAALK
jgi:DNA-binding transcriptional ArsR family regulator/uncharacterized protein YndB with AHSA1/START domain